MTLLSRWRATKRTQAGNDCGIQIKGAFVEATKDKKAISFVE
ncbi:hypothetical protein [Erwinia tasmaniensis]